MVANTTNSVPNRNPSLVQGNATEGKNSPFPSITDLVWTGRNHQKVNFCFYSSLLRFGVIKRLLFKSEMSPINVRGLSLHLLYSIVVGIVQGVAEWLPISSKTQVLLASTILFGLPLAVAYAFGLFMEIGSVLSAIIYFRKDVFSAVVLRDRKLLTYLIVVTAVTAVVGVPIYLAVEKLLENPYNVGIPMIILGVVLTGNGLYIRQARINPKIEALQQMKMRHYVAVGLAQGIAAFPGVSRSGMTTSTMLLMGVKPDLAFRLSFLAYIPAAVGAFMVTVLLSRAEVKSAISIINPTGIIIAISAAAVTGLLVISYLLRLAKHNRVYMINFALGLIALIIGLLTAFSIA